MDFIDNVIPLNETVRERVVRKYGFRPITLAEAVKLEEATEIYTHPDAPGTCYTIEGALGAARMMRAAVEEMELWDND